MHFLDAKEPNPYCEWNTSRPNDSSARFPLDLGPESEAKAPRSAVARASYGDGRGASSRSARGVFATAVPHPGWGADLRPRGRTASSRAALHGGVRRRG